MAKHEISESRKLLYYGGMIISGIGFLFFLSTFVRVAFGMKDMGAHGPSMGSFMGPPIIGMILMIVGGIMRNIGIKGTAGSGLVLDPKKARDDLKPWTKMAGGMVDDVLGETSLGSKGGSSSASEVVKVRCPECRTLNEEDARFCKSCGQGI